MNYKMLTAAALLGAIVGTTCLAEFKLSINNTKLGSTLYMKISAAQRENGEEIPPLQPIHNERWIELKPNTPYERTFSKPYDFKLLIANDKGVTKDNVGEYITEKKATYITAKDFKQNFMIKVFYASPKQGMIVQALEQYAGKRVKNNVSQAKLNELLEAGRGEVFEKTVKITFGPNETLYYADSIYDKKWKEVKTGAEPQQKTIGFPKAILIAFTTDHKNKVPNKPIDKDSPSLKAFQFNVNKNITITTEDGVIKVVE